MNGLQGTEMSTIQEVLQKEAVYCAVGRCAGRLRSSFDFEQLLNQTLVLEVQNSNPMLVRLKIMVSCTYNYSGSSSLNAE